MSVEDQVREALRRAGSERPVDVQSLYRSTQSRLAGERPRTTGWIGWRPAAIGFAAAVAVIGVVVGLGTVGPEGNSDRLEPIGGRSEVDQTFQCGTVAHTDLGPGNDDDSFLPELSPSLEPAGEAAGAPRWQVGRTADGAVLWLGNANGTAASKVVFEKTASGFKALSVDKCVTDSDGVDATRLIGPVDPGTSPSMTAKDVTPGSVRVLDRMNYDVRGLSKRHTGWAQPCDDDICLVAGEPTSYTTDTLRSGTLRPHDVSWMIIPPDDSVGLDLGLRLIAVYDHDNELRRVSWDSHRGAITWAEPVPGGGWQGQLFLFIARDADLAAVTLHPKTGEARNYLREEFLD